MESEEKIAVIGLGYVGSAILTRFSNLGRKVVAFDINQSRIQELKAGTDRNNEIPLEELQNIRNNSTSTVPFVMSNEESFNIDNLFGLILLRAISG